MKKWKVLKSKYILKHKYATVRKDTVITNSGKKSDYFIFERRSYVTIVALTRDNKLVMQKQYRHPVKKWVWQLPAGHIEKGESIEAAVKRELLEETGYKVGSKIMKLPALYHSIGRSKGQSYSVLVKKCVRVQEPTLDPLEDIVTKEISLKDAFKMIQRGELKEMSSVVALLFLRCFSSGRGALAPND